MADQTTQIFDNFYDGKFSVNANEYDIVNSFFAGYTTNSKIASSYTETLFRISKDTEIDVLTLLDTFQGSDAMKVTLTLSYYLNSASDKTILYGISNIISPIETVQRNILQ
jgi:hypothetical protein